MNKKISPAFIWTKTIFSSSPLWLIYLLFTFFLITKIGPDERDSTFAFGMDIIFFISKGLIFPFLLINIPRYMLYKRTVFEFADSSMLYRRDFISLSQKTVKYSDIKEVTLHRTPLQRMFGLGTVKIITHATTQDAGIELFNVKEFQEIYDFLMGQSKN